MGTLSDKVLFKKLRTADAQEQTGLTRHLCERHLRHHPNHAPTLWIYARCLTSLAQYSAARKALNRAEKHVPKKYLPWVLAERGHLLAAQGNFKEAEKMHLQAHKLAPNDATYLLYAANAACESGRIARAITLASKATQCTGGCLDEVWYNLGGYLLSEKDYAQAARCYREALKIDPQYEIAKSRLREVNLILRNIAQNDGKTT